MTIPVTVMTFKAYVTAVTNKLTLVSQGRSEQPSGERGGAILLEHNGV